MSKVATRATVIIMMPVLPRIEYYTNIYVHVIFKYNILWSYFLLNILFQSI